MATLARRSALILISLCAALGLAVLAVETTGRPKPPAAPTPAAPIIPQGGVRVRYQPGAYPQLSLPEGRQEEIHSVLKIDRPMTFGSYVWDEEGVPEGAVWVRVDIPNQLISVFRGGDEIGSAVILYGAESKPTPAGAFTVLQKARDYHSRTYDAPMPFMLRLTADGVAIHGSDVLEGWATHGCIGVPPEFARRLFAEMQLGDAVFIVT